MNTDDPHDRYERLLSLKMDDRLDADGERELAAMRESSAEIQEIERTYDWARGVMRSEALPPIPDGLQDRILARVASSRENERAGGQILVFAKRLSLAAAVLFGVLLLGIVYDSDRDVVNAGNQQPSIEDTLNRGTDVDGSIVPFLREHFLGERR